MPGNSVLVRCAACRTLNRVPLEKLTSHPNCGQCKTLLAVPHEPIKVTTTSYDQQVRDWPETVLAEFWAKWCGYCRKIEPFVNDLALRRTGRLKVVRIDVDSEKTLAGRFVIKATPTFILYRNNRQIGRMDGAPARETDLELWIDQTVYKNSAQG
jgi:thioredoxin 2